jgi:hypothetical protein
MNWCIECHGKGFKQIREPYRHYSTNRVLYTNKKIKCEKCNGTGNYINTMSLTLKGDKNMVDKVYKRHYDEANDSANDKQISNEVSNASLDKLLDVYIKRYRCKATDAEKRGILDYMLAVTGLQPEALEHEIKQREMKSRLPDVSMSTSVEDMYIQVTRVHDPVLPGISVYVKLPNGAQQELVFINTRQDSGDIRMYLYDNVYSNDFTKQIEIPLDALSKVYKVELAPKRICPHDCAGDCTKCNVEATGSSVDKEKIERFKRELFMRDISAIEEFLGYTVLPEMEKDVIDYMLDQKIDEMPRALLLNWFYQYGIE